MTVRTGAASALEPIDEARPQPAEAGQAGEKGHSGQKSESSQNQEGQSEGTQKSQGAQSGQADGDRQNANAGEKAGGKPVIIADIIDQAKKKSAEASSSVGGK